VFKFCENSRRKIISGNSRGRVHILKVQGQYLQANATGGQGTACVYVSCPLPSRRCFFKEFTRKTLSHNRVATDTGRSMLLQTYKLPKTATMGGNMLLSKQ